MPFDLPPAVRAIVDGYFTCELATMAKDGTPIAWPVTPIFRPEHGDFIATTSIGLPTKAFNLRRDPRATLLFSNPHASGVAAPGQVLVQARGTVSDRVQGDLEGLEALFDRISLRQPAGDMFAKPPMKWFGQFYWWRLVLTFVPERILHFPAGASLGSPEEIEVRRVG